ncbi:MAG TPA: hypothetical protein ENK83_01655 [Aliiroseovarius sp.]|nr:hypothetical protein [Aliiroseovarius sp.]
MSDISELEGRITAALDRIGQGLDVLGPKADAVAGEEVQQLRVALEEERVVNAQLDERVRAIREKQESTVAQLTEEVERLRGVLEEGEAGVAHLRKVNSELRANNAALRDAVAQGLAEPHLVNKSMMAELEALRATQAADRSELDAVLAELAPLVAPAPDADGEGSDSHGESEDA